MENHYSHMERDIERDLIAYIMGIWHMHKINKMVSKRLPAYRGKID